MREYEDDFASIGEPGLANFAAALLEPLESQARGFTHGHKKVIGVPRASEEKLRKLFEQSDDALQETLKSLRDQVVECAATIMYDCAAKPGEQVGETVLPEPFSKTQQLHSRLDGGEEIDGSKRALLEVTAPEPQGHVVCERILAEAELRACRNFYREVPLTGCQQSALPRYRLPQAFGRIEPPDEHGLWHSSGGVASDLFPATDEPWIQDQDGKVTGLRLPGGAEASSADIEQDARAWATAFARDSRSCMVQNHDHDCAYTCVKYAAKQSGTTAGVPEPDASDATKTKASSWVVPPCRFLFFVILVLAIWEGAREVVRRALRRGKKLVSKAFVAATNDRNEYGSVVP